MEDLQEGAAGDRERCVRHDGRVVMDNCSSETMYVCMHACTVCICMYCMYVSMCVCRYSLYVWKLFTASQPSIF